HPWMSSSSRSSRGLIFGGWRTGFLDRLIGVGFMALSFVASAYFRYPVGAFAGAFLKDVPTEYVNVVGYAIAFPVVLGALHLGRHLLLGRIRVQGLTKEVDAALGAIMGGVEAVLIISAAVVILDTYFGTSPTLGAAFPSGSLKSLTESFNASTTVHLLRGTTVPVVLAILGPFLPKDVTTILPGGLPTGLPGGLPGFPSPKP
ncbi:MAG: CvpA family protein, partial [Candidatus Limnocylindrales bacterium]